MAVTLGDNTADLTADFDLDYGYAYVYGNVLYFRPIAVTVSGTLIQSLSTYLLPNPNAVVHVRLGLFSLNGTIAAPSWTLITQAAEQVLINPIGGAITAPLPSAVSLASGYYAVGVWFDQPVYSLENYWFTTPSVNNLYQAYTSVSASGAMPGFAVPIQDYLMAPSAANGCVLGQSTVQFSFCAAFQRPPSPPLNLPSYDLYSGVLTALSVPQQSALGSYWAVISGNGTLAAAEYRPPQSFTLGSIANPTMQRLYDSSTTGGGVALDSTGLQLYYNYYSEEPVVVLIASKQIPYTPAYTYTESEQYYFSNPANPAVGPGEFTYQRYQPGATLPNCTYQPTTYANIVQPASLSNEACAAVGQIQVSYGDAAIADFANQKEGNSIPGLTLYSNSFTAISGVTLTQVAVDILSNTGKALSIQMGVYSSSGILLGSTAVVSLIQAYDQQVVAALTSPVSLTAGVYYLAVVANSSLALPTSTVSSPTMSVSSLASGLPPTFTLTGSSAGAVPLVAYGCAAASHSICMYAQYYTPASMGGPMSTVYLYQGLVTGTSNSDGSVSVQLVNLHGTVLQRPSSYISTNVVGFAQLLLAGPSRLYPNAAAAVDGTGLALWSSALQQTVNLTYSAAVGQYVDTWGSSSLGLKPTLSGFTLTALTAPVSISSCSALTLPSVTSSSPAPPSCPAGQTAVTLGDDNSVDYAYNQEEIFWTENSFISTTQVSTGASAVALSQVAVALNKNFNTIARMSFALYDASQRLLASTGELVLTNPGDTIAAAAFPSPYVLAPNTSYFLAYWSDDSLYMPFTFNVITPCAAVTYVPGAPWPASIPNEGYFCGAIALAGLGCTTSFSPLTSSSSSDSANLSKGAVAGIVVGCVLGSNLLLLVCLFVFMSMVRGASWKSTRGKSESESESDSATPHMELAETQHSSSDE